MASTSVKSADKCATRCLKNNVFSNKKETTLAQLFNNLDSNNNFL